MRASLHPRTAVVQSIKASYLEASVWETLQSPLRRRRFQNKSIALSRLKGRGGSCSAVGL